MHPGRSEEILKQRQNAIRRIDGRRRSARPVSTRRTKEIPASAPDLRGTPSTVGMAEWLQLLGHSVCHGDPALSESIVC